MKANFVYQCFETKLEIELQAYYLKGSTKELLKSSKDMMEGEYYEGTKKLEYMNIYIGNIVKSLEKKRERIEKLQLFLNDIKENDIYDECYEDDE
jgi:hypothetical protein